MGECFRDLNDFMIVLAVMMVAMESLPEESRSGNPLKSSNLRLTSPRQRKRPGSEVLSRLPPGVGESRTNHRRSHS